MSASDLKEKPFLQKAIAYFRSHWKWLAFGFGCILFLYIVYFAFCFKTSPTYESADASYWNVRNILFRVFCGVLDVAIFVWGMFLLARGRLHAREACILLSFIAMITAMCYSFSTPIWDYARHWNQHDDNYASASGQYLMSDGNLDGGSGHFGLIMTFFRYMKVPEIKQTSEGVYDFSFSAVGERYQPKTFYLLTALFMRFNSLFMHGAEGNVSINGYAMSNTEWLLFESARILWTGVVWLGYYYIYKTLRLLGLKGRPLALGYALIAFCPMFFFFANWCNNDGMSAFFGFAALYRGLSFYKKKDWKNCCLCALDIGLSMSCKLGGAIVALAILPLLLLGFVQNVKESKGRKMISYNPWTRNLLQGLVFALIVFPIGLFWPMYNNIRFGQDILFFSDAKNSRLSITMNLYEACFLWPNKETFWSIFVYHFEYPGWNQIQDVSLTSNLLKKTLYNEYQWGHSYVQLSVLYVVACLVTLYALIMLPIRFVVAICKREKPKDWARLVFLSSVLAVNYGWEVWFVFKSPYTCNCDMRYIPTFMLGFAGLCATHFESNEEHIENPIMNKVSRGFEIALVACFVGAVVLSYTTVCAWYAPLKV